MSLAHALDTRGILVTDDQAFVHVQQGLQLKDWTKA
jgi:hypothetical protein